MDNNHSPRPNTSSTTTLSQSSTDTTSNSNHGWSFLQQTTSDPNTSSRSVPPSTYIRSSTSTSSRSPLNHYNNNNYTSSPHQSLSRSLLNQFSLISTDNTNTTGHRSTTTNPSLPSQPVLLRINANNAYTHTNPTPRRSHCARPIYRDKTTSLPALEEFSVQGILSAINEDIEGDLAVISEVLGRSRFVLADQYESQMAPLGEIRSVGPGGFDVMGGDEDLRGVADDVLIMREDASLPEGSNSGSAAYGLLERLQAVPRMGNIGGGGGVERLPVVENVSLRNDIVQPEPEIEIPVVITLPATAVIEARDIAATRPDGPARAVVSETRVSAEADGVSSRMVPIVFEAGRQYPLYTHSDTDVFESPTVVRESTVSSRRRSGFHGITSWLSRGSTEEVMDAEARLRGLLNR